MSIYARRRLAALLGQLEEDYWRLQTPLFIGEGLGYAAGGDTLTGDFDGDDAADPTRSEINEAGNAAEDLDELDCGQSFTPATLVLLAGGKTVPIADLRPGDKVLATNVKTGKTQPETVTAVLVNHDHDLYDLTIRSGNKTAVIHTTSNHLFWDPSLHKFLPASNLKPGTQLKTPAGRPAVVVGGSVPADHDGWMWDLTVPGNNDHDFYVDIATTAVLVHNCGGLIIDDSQFGAKIGKHAQDFGLNPADPADRQALRDTINNIYDNPDEIRQGPWNPKGGGGTDYLFYRQGDDVVVANSDNVFVTILKDGVGNGWFRGASPLG